MSATVSAGGAAQGSIGRRATWPVLAILAVVLAACVVVAGSVGAFRIAPAEVAAILLSAAGIDAGVPFTEQQERVLFAIRLPRVLMAVLVGAGLASAGAAMQGLFRNPLADPGLIGVSSGAALAAAFVIVLGATVLPGLSKLLGVFTLPLAAFLGGLAVTLTIYNLSSRDGRLSLPVMLLAGIAVNALAGAGIGLFTYIATDEQLRNLTFWSLGSLAGAGWTAVAICAACVCVAVALACGAARALNAILLGEAEAGHLGVDVLRLKRTVIVLTALAVGTLVAFTGIIGFIGLIAPHMLRLAVGPDHRIVIPGAALLGAALTVVADTVARTIAAPAEMPIGILTALIGAPFFLGLLLRQRRAWGA
jgi:iron complex transport system permease protein